jgi:large subunit ribosomal protein L14e
MVFRRFVEIGRVALVNYGPDYGKLVVIVDVIDQNRALVDSPGMVRTQINFKRLSLTDITIPELPRAPPKKVLRKAYEDAEVEHKWAGSAWGRKLAVRRRRAAMTDFERFKVMVARVKRSSIVRRELGKLRREKA